MTHTPRPRLASILPSVLPALALAGAVGCGASDRSFGADSPTVTDTGVGGPGDDAGLTDSGATDTGAPDGGAEDAALLPKCPPPPKGKANVCVRVLRADIGPTITADTKKLLGIDGHGILAVGLAGVRPERDATFVAKTIYPSASSGVSKIAAADLPKVVDALTVEPGTYWPFGAFRDLEPWDRPSPAVGDYQPRPADLTSVTLREGDSVVVDLTIYPLRGIDLRPRLTTTPLGSGAGPARAWLVHPLKGLLMGEGGAPCVDLGADKVDPIRVFTTYTGTMDGIYELFDFGVGTDPAGVLSPGGIHGRAAKIDILASEWLVDERKVDLGEVVPFPGAKPVDSSPNCAAAAAAMK